MSHPTHPKMFSTVCMYILFHGGVDTSYSLGSHVQSPSFLRNVDMQNQICRRLRDPKHLSVCSSHVHCTCLFEGLQYSSRSCFPIGFTFLSPFCGTVHQTDLKLGALRVQPSRHTPRRLCTYKTDPAVVQPDSDPTSYATVRKQRPAGLS